MSFKSKKYFFDDLLLFDDFNLSEQNKKPRAATFQGVQSSIRKHEKTSINEKSVTRNRVTQIRAVDLK
jgi:hypothetical protein